MRTQISFRTKPDLKVRLEKLARQDNRSLSQYIETVLERHVAAEEHLLSQYFPSGVQHGFWSQTDAFEAAANLQELLQKHQQQKETQKKHGK